MIDRKIYKERGEIFGKNVNTNPLISWKVEELGFIPQINSIKLHTLSNIFKIKQKI